MSNLKRTLCFSIAKPVLVISLIFVFLGGFSLFSIPTELIPTYDRPAIEMVSIWPSASSELIEAQIAIPQENALASLSGVEEIQTNISPQYAQLQLDLQPTASLQASYLDTIQALSRVRGYPNDAQQPIVLPGGLATSQVLISLFVTAPDGFGYTAENQILVKTKVIPSLRKIEGIDRVEIADERKPAIRILAEPNKLNLYGISFDRLWDVVSASIERWPSTIAENGELKSVVREPLRNITALEQLVVTADNNNVVYLKDVAEIRQGVRASESFMKFNGRDGIYLRLYKTDDANILSTLEQLGREIDSLNQFLLDGHRISVQQSFNSLPYLTAGIRSGYFSIGCTLLLIFIVVGLYYRSLSQAIPIALGTLSGAALCVIVLHIFGLSLNLLSLAAIVIGIGIAADAPIIVQEARYSNTKIYDKFRNPLAISALTTIFVLAPLAISDAILGSLFRPVVICLVTSVLWSVLWAIYVTPSSADAKARSLDGYLPNLSRNIPSRFAVAIAGLLIVVPLGMSTSITRAPDLLPALGNNSFYVYLALNKAPTKPKLESELYRFVEKARSESAENDIFTKEVFFHFDRLATALVLYCDPNRADNECRTSVDRIASTISESPLVTSAVVRPGSLLSFGRPEPRGVRVDLIHNSYDKLKNLTASLAASLRDNGLSVRIIPNTAVTRSVIEVSNNDAAWLRQKMKSESLTRYLAAVAEGAYVGETYIESQLQDVMLLLGDQTSSFENSAVLREFDTIRLGDYVDINRIRGEKNLLRVDGARVTRLEIYPKPEKSLAEVSSEVIDHIAQSGYQSNVFKIDSIEGDQSRTANRIVTALILSFIVLFFLIYSYFRSLPHCLVTVCMYPVCLAGGLTGLKIFEYIHDTAADMMSLFALILLFGLVSNNAIIFVESYRRLGSVTQTLVNRSAGILLATLTSALSCLVLILLPTDESVVFKSFAYVIFFGLIWGVPIGYVTLSLLLHGLGNKLDVS